MKLLPQWLGDGLTGAALLDKRGNIVAIAGGIEPAEAMPLAALVMYRLKSDDLAERLFCGEIISLPLERNVSVGVAKRQLFVVATVGAFTPATLEAVSALRSKVESILADATEHAPQLWTHGNDGGSGSGPSEMQLVELGITVPRAKA